MRSPGKKTTARTLMAGCVIALALGMIPGASAATPAAVLRWNVIPGDPCAEGYLSGDAHNARWRICVPAQWNGDLVVYAHGYVSPMESLQLPNDKLGALTFEEIVQSMGYAYATTSYRANGLVVPHAVEDILLLVEQFKALAVPPDQVYVVGASEGGLIAALAVEKYPAVFSGGLSVCAPLGDFRKQINYFGDFLVAFNYFFPGVLPNCTPSGIPRRVRDNWESVYEEAVFDAVMGNPSATRQLLRVTHAPIDPQDDKSIAQTILGILWYNVFATNNAISVLGGQPFDNTRRFYTGSDNDFRLNFLIQRIAADSTALAEIESKYQATGRLSRPMITIHTTDDPIVPFFHQPAYSWKAIQSGSGGSHLGIPVFRYGHVNITPDELQAGFSAMVFAANSRDLFAEMVPALRLLVTEHPF